MKKLNIKTRNSIILISLLVCLTVLFLFLQPYVTGVYGWSEDKILAEGRYLSNPKITIDSDDNVHMVWYMGGVNTSGVYYTKLDKKGNTVVSTKIIEQRVRIFAIVTNSQNSLYLIYSNYSGIYYKKIDLHGTVVNESILLTNSTAKFSIDASIDSKDNVHIVWDRDLISYIVINKNGNIIGKETTISSGKSSHPKVTIDIEDNTHVVWRGENGIYYTKMGKLFCPIINATQITSDCWSGCDIAVDSQCNAHIVYDNRNISYLKLNNIGEKIKTRTLAKYQPSGFVGFPSITIDKWDNVHIAWQADTFRGVAVHYMKLDKNGNILIDDTQLTHHLRLIIWWSAGHPDIAADSHGNAHVIWREHFGVWDATTDRICYKTNAHTNMALLIEYIIIVIAVLSTITLIGIYLIKKKTYAPKRIRKS